MILTLKPGVLPHLTSERKGSSRSEGEWASGKTGWPLPLFEHGSGCFEHLIPGEKEAVGSMMFSDTNDKI